jgi:uncharacterized protein (DUF1810 family)
VRDPFNLERFVEAQNRSGSYDRALEELRNGRKYSHWMWWIFPQLAGLGRSSTSREYSIYSLEEARAYLVHPVLGPRLREVTKVMIGHAGTKASAILASDDVKFRSCMTLFLRAAPEEQPFQDAIDLFFDAAPDPMTDHFLMTGS